MGATASPAEGPSDPAVELPPGHSGSLGRIGALGAGLLSRLRAFLPKLFRASQAPPPIARTGSEVLFLEALHVAERRGRVKFAAQLLWSRAEMQLQSLVRAREHEKLLGKSDGDLALLDGLINGLRGTPDVIATPLEDMAAVFASALTMLDRWSRMLRVLPEAMREDIDQQLETRHRHLVAAGIDWQPENSSSGVSDVQHVRMHGDAMVGLALSGGGIRSASFSLGALESLAKAGLLPGFDVISSVSGGGYAASWLGAWAYRHQRGIVGVQDDLHKAADSSPGPLRWVSRHCAYLAPRIGSPMSSDAWALVVAYVSNWLPILALLSSAMVALLLLPNVFVVSANWLRHAPSSALHEVVMGASVAVLVIFAGVVRRLTAYRRVQGDRARFPTGLAESIFYGTLLSTLALTACTPLLWAASARLGSDGIHTVAGFTRAWGIDSSEWAAQAEPSAHVFTSLFIGLATVSALSFIIAFCLATPLGQRAFDGVRKDMVPAGALERIAVPLLRAVGASAVTALLAAVMLTGWARYSVRVAPPGPPPELLITLGPLVLVFTFAVAELAGLMLLHRFQHERDRALSARLGGWMLSSAVAWTLLCAVALGVTPLLQELERPLVAAAGLAAVVGVLVVCWRYAWLGVPLYVATALAFLLTLIHLVLRPLMAWLQATPPGDVQMRRTWVAFGVALVVTAILALLAKVNRFSLHALYKQGLVRTFLGASRLGSRNLKVSAPSSPPLEERAQYAVRRPDPVTDIDEDDDPALAWLRSKPDREMPIMLLNAAVNGRSLTDLDGRVPREWPFTFSQYHCGSPASGIGYASTESFRPTSQTAGRGAARGLSLGTAMAVSGAAMSPTSGRSTHPLRAFILGILNARLGLWIGNPRYPDAVASESPRLAGLTVLREMLGVRAKFSRWIHLSDGGHFENLGIFELVRRGCRRIVVVDASCDVERDFADLANAIRRVRMDLGIRIVRTRPWEIHHPDGQPSQAPGAVAAAMDGAWADSGANSRAPATGSARAWTWFEIDYGDGLPRGRLLYVKPSVYKSQTLPVEVQQYWKSSPAFPHESTADQFFTEAQMEAYRSLGQACMDDAMAVAAGLSSKGSSQAAYEEDPHGLAEVVRRFAVQAGTTTRSVSDPGRAGDVRFK